MQGHGLYRKWKVQTSTMVITIFIHFYDNLIKDAVFLINSCSVQLHGDKRFKRGGDLEMKEIAAQLVTFSDELLQPFTGLDFTAVYSGVLTEEVILIQGVQCSIYCTRYT